MRRSHWEDDLFSVCCKWLVVQQSLSLVFRSQPTVACVAYPEPDHGRLSAPASSAECHARNACLRDGPGDSCLATCVSLAPP